MEIETNDLIRFENLKIGGYLTSDEHDWKVLGIITTKKGKHKLRLESFIAVRNITIDLDYDEDKGLIYSFDKPKTILTYKLGGKAKR